MVFNTLRGLCNSVAESLQQQRLQQQQYQQQLSHQQQHYINQQASPPNLPPSWGLLIQPDKTTPSPLFSQLLDALFDLSLAADTRITADVLTPTCLAAIYEELGYPEADNLPLLLLRRAQQAGDARPHDRVNAGMRLAWRLFNLEHTDASSAPGVPGLTRAGFRALMVRDALICPPGQAAAHSALLARRSAELSSRGAVFPPRPIGAGSFMPPGVPISGDARTQSMYREQQAQWVAEYTKMYGVPGPEQVQQQMADSAEGWAMARQMQMFKHNMTMDALTPGYRIPDGSGGYTYHYTGGLNW
ncbi:hypothetical protein B0T11DRAFT_345065 [Plectosphaerella cucumerina]|uniref:DUF7514 domain-containing protein n=1 Tax=Plectosphaerella cucumerina TaxID=40658 RepID=A0A8K0TRK3_9PEZI|nr:hypothetical protein B0T11DRAFT_345065 [Plectosphaerella cucumerina]